MDASVACTVALQSRKSTEARTVDVAADLPERLHGSVDPPACGTEGLLFVSNVVLHGSANPLRLHRSHGQKRGNTREEGVRREA